jgi:hypothetical protein
MVEVLLRSGNNFGYLYSTCFTITLLYSSLSLAPALCVGKTRRKLKIFLPGEQPTTLRGPENFLPDKTPCPSMCTKQRNGDTARTLENFISVKNSQS